MVDTLGVKLGVEEGTGVGAGLGATLGTGMGRAVGAGDGRGDGSVEIVGVAVAVGPGDGRGDGTDVGTCVSPTISAKSRGRIWYCSWASLQTSVQKPAMPRKCDSRAT